MTSYIHKLKLYKNSAIANRFFRVDNLHVDNTIFASKMYLNGYSAIIAILSHCAVPPSMPPEAPSVEFFDIHSASSGIDGGTGYNFLSPSPIHSPNHNT